MVQIHVCVCVCVAYIFGEKWSVSLATDHGHYYSSLPLAVPTATRPLYTSYGFTSSFGSTPSELLAPPTPGVCSLCVLHECVCVCVCV